ncbi:MAG TPA: ACT domain-containing protein [Jatrophihabitantaceae bacterium]|nr:ACT domain-containing protein [Jatrophihabitantaceae bacterium]
MQPISLLVTVTGRDRPGVTAVIFAALAAHDVDVRDVVQTTSGQRARLAILVDLRGDPATLRHSVNSTAQAFGVESQVITAGADAHVVHSVPRSRSRAGRSRAVAVGTRLRAGTLGDIAKRVADVGGNIESMWQSSDDTFTGVEMSLDGESSRLRPALIASVGETGLDLAVGPAGARTRDRRLLVLDADAVPDAAGLADFVAAARRAGCKVAAVGRRRPSDRADLGLDAVAAMDDVDGTLRGLATDLDLPPSRIVVVGDPHDSARLLAAAGTAIVVDTHAAADVPGEPGFLASALYLLARI